MRVRRSDTQTITATAARVQLKMLLSGARTLDNLTVEVLARTYRLRPSEIERELSAERERRGRLI